MRSAKDPEARKALLARNRAMDIAFNSESKIAELEKILLNNKDERILIFTQHNDLVYRISNRFLIHSSLTPPTRRKGIVCWKSSTMGDITRLSHRRFWTKG